jgi:hypothetical protein
MSKNPIKTSLGFWFGQKSIIQAGKKAFRYGSLNDNA